MGQQIESIELRYLKNNDYDELALAMEEAYPNLPDAAWEKKHIRKLVSFFPEGQVVITVDGKIAAAALSLILDSKKFDEEHTYLEVTDNYSFKTHTSSGDLLYGIDIFVKQDYRGMRLGRRLYDYRKELCENLNLRAIVFGGRLPNYNQFAKNLSPKQYIDKVKNKEIDDPVLNFQLSNDFHVKKILKNYLEGDEASNEYAALLQWDNIYFQSKRKKAQSEKSVIRLGLAQWQMRPYQSLDELIEQMDFFVDAVSGYRCDFVLFPEFFNAPLMATYNDLSEPDAIRKLADYTPTILNEFNKMSIKYNINIITGSMPLLDEDNQLYNVGYLCKRNGEIERYIKIHVTPDEEKVWGMSGGNEVKVFDTDCGKIGVLICYDVEFPELSRLMVEDGMNLLFVPFLTDTQNGYSRVRHCAQARAIENECYVAITGCVGNLPKVHNMDIQYGQSAVFTPCDFAFPADGVKAISTPNTEMILIADVDIDLLRELNLHGSVRNIRDRRKDLYELKWKK